MKYNIYLDLKKFNDSRIIEHEGEEGIFIPIHQNDIKNSKQRCLLKLICIDVDPFNNKLGNTHIVLNDFSKDYMEYYGIDKFSKRNILGNMFEKNQYKKYNPYQSNKKVLSLDDVLNKK